MKKALGPMCDAEMDWHERSCRSPGHKWLPKISSRRTGNEIFFLYFKPQVALDIFDPQLDTILSVGISLTYFRRKLLKFE